MVTISFQQVRQTFHGRTIFRDLNAELTGGQITAVTGHNGSGKSTMLRLAAHLLLPTEGRVMAAANGKELRREALRRHIALVTPELKFYPRLTARENLDFLLGLRGITLTGERFRELLERVGLCEKEIGTSFAGEFSTGMRQRLKLAVLLASGTDIWLLDEPGANLDEAGRRLIKREVRQAAADGRLIFWATNDKREEEAADAAIHLAGY